MDVQLVCILLTAGGVAVILLLGAIHRFRGEKRPQCRRRGEMVHEGGAVRCRSCGSQLRDSGGGYG